MLEADTAGKLTEYCEKQILQANRQGIVRSRHSRQTDRVLLEAATAGKIDRVFRVRGRHSQTEGHTYGQCYKN